MKKYIVGLIFLSLSAIAFSQENLWQRHTILSDFTKEKYHLDIKSPLVKSNTPKILYHLDGDFDLEVQKNIVDSLQKEGIAEDIHFVFLSYQKPLKEVKILRRKDLCPVFPNTLFIDNTRASSEAVNESGNFINFLQNELFPFVNEKLELQKPELYCSAYSLSGMFVLYGLFKDKNLFQKGLIISPSLWWDEFRIFSHENQYSMENNDLQADLYWTVGDTLGNERWQREATLKMLDTLKKRNYKNLKVHFENLANLTHEEILIPSFEKGLRFFFPRRILNKKEE